MSADIEDLNAAYKRTQLKRFGVSFLSAMESPMFRKLLERIAQNQPKAKPTKMKGSTTWIR